MLYPLTALGVSKLKPLNVITLGQTESDNIKQMKTITSIRDLLLIKLS
jgi:hypothetical protein